MGGFLGSLLLVVLESAGLSRWAAEAGAEECSFSFVVEVMGKPSAQGTVTW